MKRINLLLLALLFSGAVNAATNFEDFGAIADGDVDLDADWTSRGSWWTQKVETISGATGGKALVITDNPPGYNGNQTNEAISSAIAATTGDIEVVIRMKIGDAAIDSGVALGPTLTNGAGSFYGLRYTASGTWALYYFQSDTYYTSIQTGVSSHTIVADEYFWLRLGRTGTNIHASVWSDIGTEPVTWQMSGTNSTLTTISAGVIGQDSSTTPYTIDIFGTSDGAERTAPTSAGGSQSPVPLILQQH